MDASIMIVAIVGMTLGYKLLSEFITGRREISRNKYKHREAVAIEEPGELTLRAESLVRRLATLEEIIAAERRS